MTYDAYASSLEDGRPVEVYTLTQGTSTFRYTDQPGDVVISGLTYEATAVSRSRLEETRDSVLNNQVVITIPSSNAFVTRFKDYVPASRASVTVQRYQRSDTSLQLVTVFDGYVASARFVKDGLIAEVTCIPVIQAQSRPIPRQSYQNACNHVLGDSLCKVDLTDSRWRFSSTVSAFDSTTNLLTVTGASAFGSDWWAGGVVEVDGGADYRLVLRQSGDDLALLLPFPASIVGTTVVLLAGCDHSITTCDTKFNTPDDVLSNVINYGGFAFVPNKNPFQTGL